MQIAKSDQGQVYSDLNVDRKIIITRQHQWNDEMNTVLFRLYLNSSIDMPVVELPVEIKENWVIINVRSNLISLGPRRSLEVGLGELWKAVLVKVVDLVDVALLDHVLEVLEELLDLVWNGKMIHAVLKKENI